MEQLKITINGLDNSGKTAQVDLLGSEFGDKAFISPSLSSFNSRWQTLSEEGFSDWWFEKSSTQELTQLIYESSKKRYVNSRKYDLSIIDRGTVMLNNVCAATSSIKDNLSLSDAVVNMQNILNWDKYISSIESINILLLYDNNIEHSVDKFLEREKQEVTPRYKTYQIQLYTLLLNDYKKSIYDHTIFTKGKSIITVQNEIRLFLNSNYGYDLSMFLGNINQIFGFAGLSESGKSFSSEYLRKQHCFDRKKISYFFNKAEKSLGISNIYSLNENKLAEILINEIDEYCKYHHYIKYLSIESLHRYSLTKKMKDFLGDKFKIIYLDVPINLRAVRECCTVENVKKKDLIKINRGAAKIKQISDTIYRNDKTILSLISFLDKQIATRGKCFSPKKVDISKMHFGNVKLKTRIKSKLILANENQIKLVCITGSGSTKYWKKNWSDIDLLIVSSTPGLKWCTDLYNVFNSFDYKVGFNIYTEKEFLLNNIKESSKHAKYLLKEGFLTAIYVANNFKINEINVQNHRIDSMKDIRIALPTLRRLLISEHSNLRQIYKHIVLLLKLYLRLNNIFIEGDENIIYEFEHREIYLNIPISIPPESEKAMLESIEQIHASAYNLLTYFDEVLYEI